MNAAVLKALKPGGTSIVIDHAGTGLASTGTTHRIDPAMVKAEVTKAGFAFVGESNVRSNAAGDHKANLFDPAIRGHTDQFVDKFRKPCGSDALTQSRAQGRADPGWHAATPDVIFDVRLQALRHRTDQFGADAGAARRRIRHHANPIILDREAKM